ncbi:hypothetical protein EB093_08395 [bacterium]|nr:hypothetical protein [bacterium]
MLGIKKKYYSFVVFIIGFLLEMLVIIWSGNLVYNGKNGPALFAADLSFILVNLIFILGAYVGMKNISNERRLVPIAAIGVILNTGWLLLTGFLLVMVLQYHI